MAVKVLIVPDVHGRKFWKDAKDFVDEVDQVVFLGDYADPYSFEQDVYTEPQDIIDNLKEIVQFAKDNAPKVTLLIGNHDAHYLSDDNSIQSTRYDSNVANSIAQIIEGNPDLFKKCHVIGNTIFSHAGVLKGWLTYNGFTGNVDSIEEVASFVESSSIEAVAQIGYQRGGYYKDGGPLWVDLLEHENDKDPLKFNQIVGHTQLRETGSHIDVHNVHGYDSRKVQIIEVE